MRYVLYAPHYDENSGGIIALYKLGSLLQELGYSCKVWHWTRVHRHEQRPINGKVAIQFATSPDLSRPRGECPFQLDSADEADIDGACVIYPEIVEGNPLGAQHVVRWLLNKPGAITGQVAYGLDELIFHYAPHFLPDGHRAVDHARLYIRHIPTHIYRQTNFGPRLGTCHLVRKGHDIEKIHHPTDSIQIDGLPHELVAQIFNVCEEFVSYDLHTAYSLFAALCGCRSIVVPRQGITLESWKSGSSENERAGIAYGRDDIARAQATVSDLELQILDVENENRRQALNFVNQTSLHFQVGLKYITVSDQPCV